MHAMANCFIRRVLRIRKLRRDVAKILESAIRRQSQYQYENVLRKESEVYVYVKADVVNEFRLFLLNTINRAIATGSAVNVFKASDVEELSTIVVFTNVPLALEAKDIDKLSSSHGKITTHCKLLKNTLPLRYGYIAFEDLASAENCAMSLNQSEMKSHQLSAQLAQSCIRNESQLLDLKTLYLEGVPDFLCVDGPALKDFIVKLTPHLPTDSITCMQILSMKRAKGSVKVVVIDVDQRQAALCMFYRLDKYKMNPDQAEQFTCYFALPGCTAANNKRLAQQELERKQKQASTAPTQTLKPVEPSNVSEATKPAEAAKPVQLTKPVQATKPVQVTKPAESTKPVQRTKPAETAKPVQRTKPVQPAKFVQGTKPVESLRPVQSAKPVQLAKPIQETKPAQGKKPVQGTNPVQSAKTVQGSKPAESAKPVQGTKHVESKKPVQLAKPDQSTKLVQGPKPVESVKPVQGTKPAESKKICSICKTGSSRKSSSNKKDF